MRPIEKAADYDSRAVGALKALARGDADPDQQKAALRWIVEVAAEAYAPNVAGDAHTMAFGEGRRSVGLEVARLVNMPAETLAKLREAENRGKDGR